MEQKELEKENERLTMEARNLRRAINAFKEYDEERKKYIEGLERELEETRGKLAEARSTIEKSKDADFVKRCRKGIKLYNTKRQMMQLKDLATIEEVLRRYPNGSCIEDNKRLREKNRRLKDIVNYLFGKLWHYRRADGTLVDQTYSYDSRTDTGMYMTRAQKAALEREAFRVDDAIKGWQIKTA